MNRKGNRQHSPTPPKQKWQNIYLALCVLLGMLASCETEESFYQPRFPANNIPLTRQALFKPENFFAYTDSTLKAVISALRRVEEEKHFTAPFLLKYGIPLWNFTYQLTEEEETCIFVPLYRLDKISTCWVLLIGTSVVSRSAREARDMKHSMRSILYFLQRRYSICASDSVKQ